MEEILETYQHWAFENLRIVIVKIDKITENKTRESSIPVFQFQRVDTGFIRVNLVKALKIDR